MATITAPVKEFNGVVAGVNFTDGKADTDNESAIAYFERQGYGVDKPAEDNDEEGPAGNLADLSVPKLRDYAKKKGIDLGGAKNKPEVLAAIEKAESPVGLQEHADPAAAAQLEEWLEAEKRHNDAVGGLSE